MSNSITNIVNTNLLYRQCFKHIMKRINAQLTKDVFIAVDTVENRIIPIGEIIEEFGKMKNLSKKQISHLYSKMWDDLIGDYQPYGGITFDYLENWHISMIPARCLNRDIYKYGIGLNIRNKWVLLENPSIVMAKNIIDRNNRQYMTKLDNIEYDTLSTTLEWLFDKEFIKECIMSEYYDFIKNVFENLSSIIFYAFCGPNCIFNYVLSSKKEIFDNFKFEYQNGGKNISITASCIFDIKEYGKDATITRIEAIGYTDTNAYRIFNYLLQDPEFITKEDNKSIEIKFNFQR